MTNFKIFLFIFLHFIVTYAKISDLRKCANEDCSEPISLAKTVTKYYADDSRILSFPPNVDVKIFSKEAGSRLDLWGAEIKGKRGYVPISHVRENKILTTKLDFSVPTEGQDDPTFKPAPTISTNNPLIKDTSSTTEPSLQEQISPQAVTPSYEVIDGTTIYLGPNTDSSLEYSTTLSSIDSSVSEDYVVVSSETNSLDQKSVDHLASSSETKEEIKENTIVKDVTDKEENKNDENEDEDNDVEEEDDGEEEEDDDVEEDENEEENDVEISSEAQQSTEVPKSLEQANSEKYENILEPVNSPEIINTSQTIDSTVNNSASVISSPEPVVENADQLNLNPVSAELPLIQPVVESKSEEVPSSAENLTPDEVHVAAENLKSDEVQATAEDLKTDEGQLVSVQSNTVEIQPLIAELYSNKEDKVEESIEKNNGVPSVLSNPLNLFHQTVNEVKDEPKPDVIQNKVPENLFTSTNENGPSSPLSNVEDVTPTTQASIDESILPNIDNIPEIITENPGIINDQIQIDSVLTPIIKEFKNGAENSESNIKEIPESVKVILPDIKHIEDIKNSAEIKSLDLNSLSEKLQDMQYDKSDKPIFIDTVGEKYNSHVIDEIPQPNNFDQNIENVSDSFDEITDEQIKEETPTETETTEIVTENEEPSIITKIYNSVFGSSDNNVVPVDEPVNNIQNSKLLENDIDIIHHESMWENHLNEKPADKYLPPEYHPEISNTPSDMQSCATSDNPAICGMQHQNNINNDNLISSEEISWSFEVPENAYNIFLYLSLTAVTVLFFSLGFYYIEKKRKDGTLIECINSLEKKLLITSKECLILQDELKVTKERLVSIEDSSFGSNEMVTSLKEELDEARGTRIELEEQVTNLEKELENATEAGMELNRMLREILTSQSGNEHLMQNVEQLQKQLNEQQETINSMKATLSTKNTENELLQTELSVANEKNNQLQEELDKMVVNLLSVQEEKNNIENKLEEQNEKLKLEYEITLKEKNKELNVLQEDNKKLKQKIADTQRVLELKNNEYDLLKQGMKEIQAAQSNKDSIMALLDVSQVKAEVQQLRDEKHKMIEKLQKEIEEKSVFEKEVQVMIQEVKILKDKFDEAEKEKVEAQTRLEVLSTYFKEKEAQLQKEINENETKFMQKDGEATSTIERIKWIQEELQNYKSQNELLKKEILDQEVSLKSQISMLEKKSHDNWVLARQAERRLEESKQEASQLRNRLTIVEKNLNNSSHLGDESKLTNRIMSPLESNGELPVSPLHMSQVETPGSPPLLFPHRDHMPPFLPPPPGVPFMPPPMPGVPPFMPPPPALFPGDHRPPPLGRMSSPPLHGRYSPDSRAYSPYDRDDSPPLSPSYADSDYRRRSPSPGHNYNPYSNKQFRHWEREEDRDRDYRGSQQRNKPRTHKGLSSGSGNSNESLDNSGRHSGRV